MLNKLLLRHPLTHVGLVGNAGIGLETVRGLATRGATVVIGSRDTKKAQHAVQELQQASGDYQGAIGRFSVLAC